MFKKGKKAKYKEPKKFQLFKAFKKKFKGKGKQPRRKVHGRWR